MICLSFSDDDQEGVRGERLAYPNDLRVLPLDRQVQGSLLIHVLEIQVRFAHLHQQFRHFDVVVQGR